MDVWIEEAQKWITTNGMVLVTNILVFLLILIVGKILIGLLCRLAQRSLRKAERVSEMLEKFAIDILRKALWVLVLMIALSQLGIEIGPLIAGLGVTGFILGFAFQESLGNLAAGIMIMLNQPFKIGDYIEAAGHSGAVRELNLMATTMTTPDNKKIVIPNRSIWGGSITNYSAMDTRRVDMTVGISYSADIAKAKEVIHRILATHDKVLQDPESVVEVVEMADSSVNLVVRPWCKTTDYWAVFFDLNRSIKENFDQEGIEINYPVRKLTYEGFSGTPPPPFLDSRSFDGSEESH